MVRSMLAAWENKQTAIELLTKKANILCPYLNGNLNDKYVKRNLPKVHFKVCAAIATFGAK